VVEIAKAFGEPTNTTQENQQKEKSWEKSNVDALFSTTFHKHTHKSLNELYFHKSSKEFSVGNRRVF
jgi:hypothetical protein